MTVENWIDEEIGFGNLQIRAGTFNDINILLLWNEIKGTSGNGDNSIANGAGAYQVQNAAPYTIADGWTNSEQIKLINTTFGFGFTTIQFGGSSPLGAGVPTITSTTSSTQIIQIFEIGTNNFWKPSKAVLSAFKDTRPSGINGIKLSTNLTIQANTSDHTILFTNISN